MPWLADRVEALATFDDVKLLDVRLERLRRWYADGLLLIGDAAHAMSPVGGVGINLAVQDAVAAGRILGPVLRKGQPVPLTDAAGGAAPAGLARRTHPGRPAPGPSEESPDLGPRRPGSLPDDDRTRRRSSRCPCGCWRRFPAAATDPGPGHRHRAATRTRAGLGPPCHDTEPPPIPAQDSQNHRG